MKLKSLLILFLFIISPLKGLECNEPLLVPSGQMTFWTESLGDWSSKAVILVSGAGANAHMWPDYLCERLVNGGYFVIRYDLRDVGLSTPSPTNFSIKDLADDVVTILDAYNLERAHVVGISMGGMVAQFVAVNYPDRVKSITLMATAPIGATPILDRPLSFSELLTLSNTLHFLSTHFLPTTYSLSDPVILERYTYFNGSYSLDLDLLNTYLWNMYHRTHYLPNDWVNVHQNNVQKLMSTLHKRRDIFKKIHAPTFVIHGKLDNLILPSRGGEALAAAIADAKLKIYPKMGHGIFNKDLLDELAEDIVTFMNQHETD